MRQKSEVFDHYRKFTAWIRTQFGVEIKMLHSDKGGEYLSGKLTKYLEEHGTNHSLAAHDMHEMNGITERLNLMLLDHLRVMLAAS